MHIDLEWEHYLDRIQPYKDKHKTEHRRNSNEDFEIFTGLCRSHFGIMYTPIM